MEVLSLILSHATAHPEFRFHWKTKPLNLTHLMFADDLLLFCHGDPTSVKLVKQGIDLFTEVSGLQLNPSKSTCLMASILDSTSREILDILGFQKGSFPTKFLGLPLLISKLSHRDCQPLLDRILNRLNSWTNVTLSYAGRLQLIKSIIIAIQGYWSTHFILPALVRKTIQQLVTRFLWKGSILHKHGAKVRWSKITLPLEEGRLGIKDLKDWNIALLLRQLLKVLNPDDSSIWVRWVRKHYLHGKSFWLTHTPNGCSWTWRKIVALRNLVLPRLTYEIGNGEHTALWTDPWINNKPLVSHLSSPLITNSGISCFAKVSAILRNSAWNLPSSNHHLVLEFRQAFDYSRPCNPTTPDQILWDGININSVKATQIWSTIRLRGPSQNWASLAWCAGLPPQYSFLVWLISHKGLKTKDKLLNYGLAISPTCELCRSTVETFSHLFFSCPISFRILMAVLRPCGWRGFSRTWDSVLSSIASLSSYSKLFPALSTGLATVTYNIWQERNSRLHGNRPQPLRSIISNTLHIIKCRAMTHKKLSISLNSLVS